MMQWVAVRGAPGVRVRPGGALPAGGALRGGRVGPRHAHVAVALVHGRGRPAGRAHIAPRLPRGGDRPACARRSPSGPMWCLGFRVYDGSGGGGQARAVGPGHVAGRKLDLKAQDCQASITG